MSERLIYTAGYLGGAVLVRLFSHPSASTFDITVLVRNAEKAKILESKFPVKVVIGSHSELDKVENLAENAHVVYELVCLLVYRTLTQLADCMHLPQAESDNVPFIEAILSGLRKRHEKLGDLPILIHTVRATFSSDL